MKKIYSILLAICLITFATAGIVTLSKLDPVVFNKPTAKVLPSPQQITFDCGEVKGIVINGTEPDGVYDDNDLRSATGANCSEEVTNIKMNGKTYQQNKHGTKSFNEDYLKNDECSRDGNYWDKEKKICDTEFPEEELMGVEE